MAQHRGTVRDSAQPRWTLWYQEAAVRFFAASEALRRRAMNAGDLADYVGWVRDNFGDVPRYRSRERLWEAMVGHVAPGQPIMGLEFGVAWGYATDWWTRHLTTKTLEWHAFDRFTGLPRAWREHGAGTFDNSGAPPPVIDKRIHWHVGDVEDTIGDVPVERARDAQVVILFDLDIYEPSAVAWRHVVESLKTGDLLYFDESYDDDERRLLNEEILPSGRFTCIGCTPLALALRVDTIG
jgi:hypothetical protein